MFVNTGRALTTGYQEDVAHTCPMHQIGYLWFQNMMIRDHLEANHETVLFAHFFRANSFFFIRSSPSLILFPFKKNAWIFKT